MSPALRYRSTAGGPRPELAKREPGLLNEEKDDSASSPPKHPLPKPDVTASVAAEVASIDGRTRPTSAEIELTSTGMLPNVG